MATMPNANYEAGARFERRVKNWLRNKCGFPVVIRSAGSKGPADLVVVVDGIPYLIQCTTSLESKSSEYRAGFREWCGEGGGIPVFAWVEYKGGPIHFARLDGVDKRTLPWCVFTALQRGWKYGDFKDD